MAAQVLFGGVLPQMGWLFFGLGMVFMWIFGAMADPGPILFNLAKLDTAPGTGYDFRPPTAAENQPPGSAMHFGLRVEREETDYYGVSYTPGRLTRWGSRDGRVCGR
jgi:hypothetical protein